MSYTGTTRVDLLDALAQFTENVVAELPLPVSVQRSGEEPTMRAAKVYKMRLPNFKQWQKKAPYILHQVLTSADTQPRGQREESKAVVRTVFCVYSEDEQEGPLYLLNLIERLRIALLRERVIGGCFVLDMEEGVESLVNISEQTNYFGGEMVTTWSLPGIEREIRHEYH